MQDREFSKAFNEEDVTDESVGNEVSLTAAEGMSDDDTGAVVIDAKTAVNDAAEEAGIDTSAGQPDLIAEAAAEGETVGEEQAEQLSPEDLQRQKSWEGRLRKREEELAAREAALGSGGNGEVPAAADDAEIAEIRQRLAEDFGDDFVGMISKLAAHEARKLAAEDIDAKLNPLQQTIAQAIQDVHAAFESMHFGAIADAHENFEQIINSPEFGAYINGLSGDEQEAAQAVLANGTPKQVINLLNAYKDSLEQKAEQVGPDASVDDALDAAEGVRGSSPVQLPGRVPVGDEDEYRAAWDAM